MKKPRLFGVLRHAITMVGRTLKSYALLSVTIVLSFSLLLGFLGYMDTSLYNEYKGIFMINRGCMVVRDGVTDSRSFDRLLQKAAELPNTQGGVIRMTTAFLTDAKLQGEDGTPAYGINAPTYFLPRHLWQFFYHADEPVDIRWLDGKERTEIDLASDEAIMDAGTFHALGLDKLETPVYRFRLSNYMGGKVIEREVRIIGVIETQEPYYVEKDGRLIHNPDYIGAKVLLPMDEQMERDMKDTQLQTQRYAIFWTDNPEKLDGIAKGLGFTLNPEDAAYRMQNTALEKIRTQKGTKALIAGAMLLILGINLYSSFTNALNSRKFEIGVKRAIGAPGSSIVRQFFYEALLVMAANILISIALVVDIGLIWKLVMETKYGRLEFYWLKYWDFVLYLSPHSAAMFAICAVSLTVVFSLIFAYQSTQVQIVDYLKAE